MMIYLHLYISRTVTDVRQWDGNGRLGAREDLARALRLACSVMMTGSFGKKRGHGYMEIGCAGKRRWEGDGRVMMTAAQHPMEPTEPHMHLSLARVLCFPVRVRLPFALVTRFLPLDFHPAPGVDGVDPVSRDACNDKVLVSAAWHRWRGPRQMA